MADQGSRGKASLPGRGIALVWQRQMRGRRPGRDLLWAAVTLAALLAVAWALQRVWLQGGTVGGHAQAVTRRWLIAAAAGAAALFPLLAALLSVEAIPSRVETEAMQAALLTQLRPFEIACGRLLAALWPLVLALALSCAFWLGAAFLVPLGADAAQILLLHLVLLSAVYMVGAVGALCATRSIAGRARERGAGAGLLWTALCVGAPLLVNPQIRRMDDPVRLIEAALLVDPVVAATTTLQLDLLRTRWLYTRSNAPDYEFAYPSPWATVGLFSGLGWVTQAATALRLRRAIFD